MLQDFFNICNVKYHWDGFIRDGYEIYKLNFNRLLVFHSIKERFVYIADYFYMHYEKYFYLINTQKIVWSFRDSIGIFKTSFNFPLILKKHCRINLKESNFTDIFKDTILHTNILVMDKRRLYQKDDFIENNNLSKIFVFDTAINFLKIKKNFQLRCLALY
ncbi:hypothetical protein [Campylobacter insulaenigrae]|uniref:hypothetical protein n=1 Tax=Campylobacter insulaenigrae TaxID=260714 RepID=UPI00215389CB|nr:hypothetical protein [Campylobacter insulaenigrae]MCR6570400.1 hypothetical protein [Campylobacter insulaenigrae]MCR6582718.1 hypothetical protein [Campylobacter insulaenigrae]